MKTAFFLAGAFCMSAAVYTLPDWHSIGFVLLGYLFVLIGLDNHIDKD